MSAAAILEEHAEVVVLDVDAISRSAWLASRHLGIGGSDAAASMGLDPYTSQYALWAEKTGEFGDDDKAMRSEPVFWGRKLEATILDGLGDLYGIATARHRSMLRSREHPWMLLNLDAIAPEINGVVEVKNVGLRQSEAWRDGEAPEHYLLQVHHALAVTGLERGILAALVGGQQLRMVEVERNDALIASLVTAERAFWGLVEARTPPEIDGSESTRKALAEQFAVPVPGSSVELDSYALDLIADLDRLKAEDKKRKEEITRSENVLKAMLGDAEEGTIRGNVVVTWKQQTRKETVQAASTFRRFTVKKPTK